MRFLFSAQFALLGPLRLRSSIEGISKPVLSKALPHAPHGRFTDPKGFANRLTSGPPDGSSSVVLETKRVHQSSCSLATDPASPGVLMRWELFQIAYRLL